jgi:hypothetical protein
MLYSVQFIEVVITQEIFYASLVSVYVQSIQHFFARLRENQSAGPGFGPFALLDEYTPSMGSDGTSLFLMFIRFFKRRFQIKIA